jgi:hypothetical protein
MDVNELQRLSNTTGCFTLLSVYDGLLHTHISVRVMFIIEDTTVTVTDMSVKRPVVH